MSKSDIPLGSGVLGQHRAGGHWGRGVNTYEGSQRESLAPAADPDQTLQDVIPHPNELQVPLSRPSQREGGKTQITKTIRAGLQLRHPRRKGILGGWLQVKDEKE